MKIAVILGSTRPGRAGATVAQWVATVASERTDATYELVDIADFNLPLLSEPTVPGAANRQYENAATRAWSAKIDEFDGFVFVTPEYNHSVPAAMKNAIDVLYPEWNRKTVGFVSYGADGGVRAVEHWRAIVANLYMVATRGQVTFSLFTDFGKDGVTPAERHTAALNGMLDELIALTEAIKPLRG